MYGDEKKKCVFKISDYIHKYHLSFQDISHTPFRGIPKGFRYNFSDYVFVTKKFTYHE